VGILRKGLFVATGGASGLVVRANSKKERTAKATEKQVRLMRQQNRLLKERAALTPRRTEVSLPSAPRILRVSAGPSATDELAKLVALRDQGALNSDEFNTLKQRIIYQVPTFPTNDLVPASTGKGLPISPPAQAGRAGPGNGRARQGERPSFLYRFLVLVVVVLAGAMTAVFWATASLGTSLTWTIVVVVLPALLLALDRRRRNRDAQSQEPWFVQ
jgi:hypothetical protein